MRTTLELDDDLVSAARRVARQRGVTLGQIISELARESLAAKATPQVRNGIPMFVTKTGVRKPNLRLVDELRDQV